MVTGAQAIVIDIKVINTAKVRRQGVNSEMLLHRRQVKCNLPVQSIFHSKVILS